MATGRKQDIELGLNRLEYGDSGREQRAVLEIETSKGYRGGVESTATVFWVGGGGRQHAFGVAGDYSVKVMQWSDIKATQAAIDRQHAHAFTEAGIADLVGKARAYYEVAPVAAVAPAPCPVCHEADCDCQDDTNAEHIPPFSDMKPSDIEALFSGGKSGDNGDDRSGGDDRG